MSGGGSSARYLQFLKNVAHVSVDCTRANRQRFCNFAVGAACCQQGQDFSFPIGKLALGNKHRLFSFLCHDMTAGSAAGTQMTSTP